MKEGEEGIILREVNCFFLNMDFIWFLSSFYYVRKSLKLSYYKQLIYLRYIFYKIIIKFMEKNNLRICFG